MDKKPNFRERALYMLKPESGEKAYRERVKRERAKASGQDGGNRDAGDGFRMLGSGRTGYGAHGASTSLASLVGWIVNGGSSEEDIDLQGSLLRKRARDLYAGGGLARSGPNTLTTNVVGWGIKPKPKIDGELLKMTDEECDRWERNTLREFQLWADSTMCDAERSKDFWRIQKLAFLSMLMSGDCFVLFGGKKNKLNPYRLTLRVLEADRISTPDTYGDSWSVDLADGGRIIDGIEIDRAGRVRRYHVCNRHPLNTQNNKVLEWKPIDAYGSMTGEPNMLHLMTEERPEQRRGIPFVSSQIEQIKQLDRYINSELAANVVAAMLTAFLESDTDDSRSGLEDAVNEEDRVTPDDGLNLELRPGAIYDLPPGKHVNTVNPIRSNTGFDGFVTALETIIGAGMDIPKEVLIKKYDSNYTAARSALLDFWKVVKEYRAGFVANFNRPVYEAWLSEAVASGRVDAPGFFEDPLVRAAWCGCSWNGISMGHVDPMKEINAAEKRISLNISTQEQEASEYNGNDWDSNIKQRMKEVRRTADMQKILVDAGIAPDGDKRHNNGGNSTKKKNDIQPEENDTEEEGEGTDE